MKTFFARLLVFLVPVILAISSFAGEVEAPAPIAWQPWSDTVFTRAREEKKLSSSQTAPRMLNVKGSFPSASFRAGFPDQKVGREI